VDAVASAKRERTSVEHGGEERAKTSTLEQVGLAEMLSFLRAATAAAQSRALTDGLTLPLGDDELAILYDEDLEQSPSETELERFRARDITSMCAATLRTVRTHDVQQGQLAEQMRQLLASAKTGADGDEAQERMLRELSRHISHPAPEALDEASGENRRRRKGERQG
jgi:hypothetical protein